MKTDAIQSCSSAGEMSAIEMTQQSTNSAIMAGNQQTSLDELESNNSDQSIKSSETGVSSLGTIFNITCSCLGLGCLFVPSTMCGSGLPIGALLITFVGFLSHWTGSALVNCTVRAKCKTLSEMIQKVLGLPAKITFDIIMFLLLCGAVGTYILLMSLFTLQFVVDRVGEDKLGKDFIGKWFRLTAIGFALGPCLVLLLINNMKVLSYISLVKVGVIVSILFITAGFAASEYKARAGFVQDYIDENPDKEDEILSKKIWPMVPTLFGIMKGISSMICSFLFHIGANDMYNSLKDKSIKKWRKCSLYGVTTTVIITVGFALVGHLSTANSRMYEIPDKQYRKDHFHGRVDVCTGNQSKIYFQLYNQENMVMKILNIVVIIILVLSYPLYFYFLKNYVLRFWKETFAQHYNQYSEMVRGIASSVVVWIMTVAFAIISSNPFDLLDLSTSFLASIAVLIIPTAAWIKMNGGFLHAFTFGITEYIPFETCDKTSNQTSRLSVILGAVIMIVSCLFMISGATTSTLNFALSDKIKENDAYPWRINGLDFNGSMRPDKSEI